MGSSTMRLGVVLLCVTAVLASEMTTQFDDGDTVVTDPASEAAATNDAAITPEQTEGGISQRLNQESGSETGAQVADATQPGKDMVCVCKRIKKPANVKCNRTVEIEEPPQDPKTLKELVQCTPGGYNLTQAQRLLLRKEAKQRQEMELQQEKFEVDRVKLMTTCISGHCNPTPALTSAVFFPPPPPIEPQACYDRCQDNQCKPIWKNPAQGWEDWYACVQQCVSGCYIIQ